MRPFTLRKTVATLVAALGLGGTAQAEDIDLFTSPSPTTTAPNILIILDNSANWNRNDQAWVGINGESPFKQGQSELRALRNLMDDPSIAENVNMGLFMMSSGGPADSGYPRFHIRQMNAANKWNTFEITAEGSRIAAMLNGIRMFDVRDLTYTRGPIALQRTGGVIKFRSVRVRPL